MLGGLIEVILYVQDMNVEVAFYRDKLGLEVSYPEGSPDFSKESWVALQTGQCTLALHNGGNRRFGVDSPKIVFQVRDIKDVRNELLKRGATIGEVRPAAPGIWVCDGMDPEGNEFSIESDEHGQVDKT